MACVPFRLGQVKPMCNELVCLPYSAIPKRLAFKAHRSVAKCSWSNWLEEKPGGCPPTGSIDALNLLNVRPNKGNEGTIVVRQVY